MNNNGTIGKGVGQVGVRLAYGFQLYNFELVKKML
jgi:hypothetical protein